MRFVKTGWLNSLSVKMVLAYVAGASMSIAVFVLVAVSIVSSEGKILSRIDITDHAQDMAEMLRFGADGAPVGFDDSKGDLTLWLYDSFRQEAAYRVLDASGKVVLSSAPHEDFWPTSGEASRLKGGGFDFEQRGVSMLGATGSVVHDGKVWFLQFAASDRFMRLMYRFALPFTGAGVTLFSLVMLFVFGGCAYLTLRFTLKPLRDISESAAVISPQSLHTRLQTDAVPKEITPLVHSFNRTLERLENGYRIQQEFLATAAHELKTPLALIRAQVELADPSPNRDVILQDVEHMTRQVQQLLHLAEVSEAQNYQLTMVDVVGVADQAAVYLQRMARAADVELDLYSESAAVRWPADRGAMFTLLKNLLENAIQHAPRGTRVTIQVNSLIISVRDCGLGVEPDQLPSIFVRFWRGPHRRDKGAGLGLAICQEIARAHGWTLCAKGAKPGLRIALSRPATVRDQLAV
jgi:signal transduction histidine kinase